MGSVLPDHVPLIDQAQETRKIRVVPERYGAAETAALIASWFADSTELSLVEYGTHEVGDRLQVAYRFEGVEEAEPYVVEQQLYATLANGVIERADLVCSGFRPRP